MTPALNQIIHWQCLFLLRNVKRIYPHASNLFYAIIKLPYFLTCLLSVGFPRNLTHKWMTKQINTKCYICHIRYCHILLCTIPFILFLSMIADKVRLCYITQLLSSFTFSTLHFSTGQQYQWMIDWIMGWYSLISHMRHDQGEWVGCR